MTASNVTRDALEHGARVAGVKLEMRALNATGTRWQVKVNLSVPSDAYTPAGRRKKGRNAVKVLWQRTSAGYGAKDGQKVHAVCWHGFRAFFRGVYEVAPDARFKTAMATYDGVEGFEATHPGTGYRNIGSQARLVQAREACECWEDASDYDTGPVVRRVARGKGRDSMVGAWSIG
jgi:hypothetical protein